jgi:hypothetical protein
MKQVYMCFAYTWSTPIVYLVFDGMFPSSLIYVQVLAMYIRVYLQQVVD